MRVKGQNNNSLQNKIRFYLIQDCKNKIFLLHEQQRLWPIYKYQSGKRKGHLKVTQKCFISQKTRAMEQLKKYEQMIIRNHGKFGYLVQDNGPGRKLLSNVFGDDFEKHFDIEKIDSYYYFVSCRPEDIVLVEVDIDLTTKPVIDKRKNLSFL